MRLREVGERLSELLESAWDEIMSEEAANGLIESPKVLPASYRAATSGAKTAGSVAWQTVEFQPHASLIDPFRLYPSRFVALQRVHRQSSGILELATHISSELPGPNDVVQPHFYTSFSSSKNVETRIKEDKDNADDFKFWHTGAILAGAKLLPSEFCLPGFESALATVELGDAMPGLITDNGEPKGLNVGSLRFYNQGRTPDRKRVGAFLANNIALAMVARSVSALVKKSMPDS